MAGRALDGWRILIPRGGSWGDEVAALLREAGADPVVAPLIAFEAPIDGGPLAAAVERLAAGEYDWLVVTSATAAAALSRGGARVPERTRVAAADEHSATAARAAGLAVDFTPPEPSAGGLVAAWPGRLGDRVLLPQSQLADPTLTEGLADVGADVDHVTAYRAEAVRPTPELVAEVAAGSFSALLVTAGSVAAGIADEFPTIPADTEIVALGRRTAGEAATAGLRVSAVVEGRSGAAIVDALAELAGTRSAD